MACVVSGSLLLFFFPEHLRQEGRRWGIRSCDLPPSFVLFVFSELVVFCVRCSVSVLLKLSCGSGLVCVGVCVLYEFAFCAGRGQVEKTYDEREYLCFYENEERNRWLFPSLSSSSSSFSYLLWRKRGAGAGKRGRQPHRTLFPLSLPIRFFCEPTQKKNKIRVFSDTV